MDCRLRRESRAVAGGLVHGQGQDRSRVVTPGPAVYASTGLFWFREGDWWREASMLSEDPRIVGLQLMLFADNEDLGMPGYDVVKRLLERFEAVAHPVFPEPGPIEPDGRDREDCARVLGFLERYGLNSLILHADRYFKRPEAVGRVVEYFAPRRVLLENMRGRNLDGAPADYAGIMARHPTAGFVLDVAHVEDLQDDRLQPWSDEPLLMERLAMVHVSCSGLKRRRLGLPAPHGLDAATHLPGCMAPEYPDSAQRRELSRVPLILEGCLPPGKDGAVMLGWEVAFAASWG